MPNVITDMIVRELSSTFKESEGMVIVSLKGLSVAESEDLRDSLAEKGVRLRMVRNRLAKLALSENGLQPPDDLFMGSVAFMCGDPEDAINAAKVIWDSEARKQGKVAIRGGLLDGEFLAQAEASRLADLPGRDELRGMLLSCLIGPQRSLVGLLAAPHGALARAIQAHVDAEGGSTEES